jgi:oligopeptide/dipeptide ABC transporter ATP-binding protein
MAGRANDRLLPGRVMTVQMSTSHDDIKKSDASPLLLLQDLRKTHRLRRGLWDRLRGRSRDVNAVDGVTLPISQGTILGLVGESGCGKSTLARMMVGLTPPTGGAVMWGGTALSKLSGAQWRGYRADVQMVFQDTHSSLNPRKRIRTILTEALAAHGVPRPAREARIAGLLDQVGIDARLLGRYPHELSGGQRQRIGIARALAMEPSLLVADEPVSSLDVSLQGQIINLLRELNASLGLTIVLISHDLAVVARICDQVAVMYGGQVVESGAPAKVLSKPSHPYTQALLDAVPRGLERRARRILPVETVTTEGGCRFRSRCVHAIAVCTEQVPSLRSVGQGHLTACHLREPATSSSANGNDRVTQVAATATLER